MTTLGGTTALGDTRALAIARILLGLTAAMAVARRIASIGKVVTEIPFALGAEDEIVADDTTRPVAGHPKRRICEISAICVGPTPGSCIKTAASASSPRSCRPHMAAGGVATPAQMRRMVSAPGFRGFAGSVMRVATPTGIEPVFSA